MRETVERITMHEANARMDLGDIGLEQHYLGRSGHRGAFALSNASRDAIAVFRPPIAASWNRALTKPLELSRLMRTVDRTAQLSAFVAAALKWVRSDRPECSCVLAYTDTSVLNQESGVAHSGIVYQASNFSFVGTAPAAEPHWIDTETGQRINRQSVYRMLGTKAKAAVAAAQPGWRYVPGIPKRLYVYPMALSVAGVLERLNAVPRAAGTRPFKLAIHPPYRPWE